MRGWVFLGQSLLGAAGLSVGLAGCAGQHDDALRLSEELGRARSDATWQQARAAELEARMSQLEQRTGTLLSARHDEDPELVNRLDRLLAMNQSLLVDRAEATRAAAAANAPPAAAGLVPAAQASTTSAPALNDEQQLRALVERLRGRPGSPHGGLTREQENALRVLLRPERKLDSENPWPPAFY